MTAGTNLLQRPAALGLIAGAPTIADGFLIGLAIMYLTGLLVAV